VTKVLIIRCGALGDLVYATSVIDAMKKQFGEDTVIDFVSTPGTAKLFEKDDRVNQVFPLKHKKIPVWLSSQKKEIIKYSKNNPYDILINFEYGKQFKSLINTIVAKRKVGANLECEDIPSYITHAVDTTKYMFKNIVSPEVFDKSFPRLIGTNVPEVKNKFNLPEKYLIISPSNSHQKRNILNYRAWENESWKKLIEKLYGEIDVVIIGNKGEDEFFDKLKPYPNGVIDLVGKTSLVDLIGVINGATGLIATDTGTAHIASAVNTEVFALIGPTPANVTGPYQSPFNRVHIISSNKDCSPCYKTDVMKACEDNICMKDISVDMVYSSVKLADLL
jgi:ADP-heptose:LPS heptosyltransferase